MAEAIEIEGLILALKALQVDRRQIARRIVEEHVLGTGVRGVDASRFRTGMPIVDRGVELESRIGRGPGGVGDLLPQVARRYGLVKLAVRAAYEVPVATLNGASHEGFREPDRVVRVLPRDRDIGVGIPIGIIGREGNGGVALAGELDGPLNVILWNQ